MKNSASFYTNKKILARELFTKKPKKIYGINTTEKLVSLILEKATPNSKIHDIGTGSGHLPKLLLEKATNKVKIVGCDLSEKMINRAISTVTDQRATFEVADNFNLPYKNNSFNITTNKLVTNFSAPEIFRVLKKGGYFFFKEYGEFKGLKEISQLFPKRIQTSNPYDYVKQLQEAGFGKINVQFYYFNRKYTKIELKQVLEMAPIIKNYTKKDWIHIEKNLFKSKDYCLIGSDPFILKAQKIDY